jgi:hypothetical protein
MGPYAFVVTAAALLNGKCHRCRSRFALNLKCKNCGQGVCSGCSTDMPEGRCCNACTSAREEVRAQRTTSLTQTLIQKIRAELSTESSRHVKRHISIPRLVGSSTPMKKLTVMIRGQEDRDRLRAVQAFMQRWHAPQSIEAVAPPNGYAGLAEGITAGGRVRKVTARRGIAKKPKKMQFGAFKHPLLLTLTEQQLAEAENVVLHAENFRGKTGKPRLGKRIELTGFSDPKAARIGLSQFAVLNNCSVILEVETFRDGGLRRKGKFTQSTWGARGLI